MLVAARGPLLRAVAAAAIDLATGDRVAFGALDVGGDRAIARDVVVRRAGNLLLSIDRAEIRYVLRDLLPGGKRRYGLSHVALDGVRVELRREADGTFAYAAPAAAAAAPGVPVAAPATAPFDLTATVSRGSVAVIDPYRVLSNARHLALDDVAGTATLAGNGRVAYRGTADVAGDRTQRVAFAGRLAGDGTALHSIDAHGIAIAPLADYFINASSARVTAGIARDLNLRVYAFAGPDGTAPYHVSGSARIDGGAMRVPGLLPPASSMRGRIDLYDGGIASPHLRARLGPSAVTLGGGIFNWSAPAFRLGIAAPDVALDDARAWFHFSQHLPLAGRAAVTSFVEGPVASPVVATRVIAPALTYARFPVTDAAGRAIYYAAAVDVVGARGIYGGIGVAANGAIDLGAVAHTQLVVAAHGPAASLPYVAELAPGASLDAAVLLTGDGLQFDARGAAQGAGGGARLFGVFHVDPHGDGAFGPLQLERDDGSRLAGAFDLARSRSESAFWLTAERVPYARLAAAARLPGVGLEAPPFGGRLSGSVAGIGPPSAFRIAGAVRAQDVRVGNVRLDAVAGNVAGALGNLRLGRVHAHGPWGAFDGGGSYAGARLALEGDYRGGFAQLATLTGNLGGSGPVDGPVALLVDPRTTVVQARGDRAPGARIHGVPVDDLTGTLAVTGGRLRVYAATALLGGGTFAAAGTLAAAQRIGVSVAGADAGQLSALAPLGPGGRVAAIGAVALAAHGPRFDGGAAVGEGASIVGWPLAVSGDVGLAGTQLDVRGADARFGAAVGTFGGRVRALGTRSARYDLDVHLTAARLGPFARAFAPARHDIAGTLAGDARVTGTAVRPALSGRLRVPEATVNGLAFGDASAQVAVDPGGLVARRGRVTVGTTHVAFGALLRDQDAALRVDAPRADLADFNDYFDAGDTLGGRGRVAARFRRRGGNVRTNADIAIDDLSYHRFPLGEAKARWYSGGSKVSGSVAFGGTSGRLETAGVLYLAARAPLREMLGRSRFAGDAHLRGLDLGIWLPALGYQLPLAGRVDADATIAGRLSDPDVATTATLVDGSIGRFRVDRFDVAATSSLSRTTITRAELDLPSLAVTGSGRFGLRASDPVQFAVHAKSPNVGALTTRFLGAAAAPTGSAEVDAKIDGTRAAPHVSGGFDVEQAALRGVKIPRAIGEFSVRGRDVVLSDVEVAFATGALYFAGSVPLEFAPVGIGPAQAPITLDLAARGVDLANFAPLLPAGSTVAGRLDGHVAVGGTAGNPSLHGSLALANGSLTAPAERQPLSGLRARLSFEGNRATLDELHAEAGGGTFDATGSAQLAGLVQPGAETGYALNARATRLRLDLPAYGTGQVDGNASLAHRPGSPALLAGDLTLSEATIPFSALLLAAPGSTGLATIPATSAGPPVLNFDLALAADRNVRVRSANIDIGARGSLHAGGSLDAPSLAGTFTSTGGTLAYFNTVFRLIDGTVTFEPDQGVIPSLAARATTHVINPDPNAVRNVAGSADITLELTGPVTNLTIGLTSDPAYDRQQILGLLLSAPALGATTLFGQTGQSPTLYGTTASGATTGSAALRPSNGEFSVAQEAFGIANAQFTRTLLAPIETSFANAVGLSSFNVNVDLTGNVGFSARKELGKKVNALYGTSLGYPYRQTFGFEYKPNAETAAQVTVFQTFGATGVDSLTPITYITATNQRLQAAQPTGGSAGFSLSLQRLFR